MVESRSGTVTFLFTDIEGSTRLLREAGRTRYAELLARHGVILTDACERHGGEVVDTQGDAFFFAFRSAGDAVAAAVDAQRKLASDGSLPRVRMGIHTGEASRSEGRYVGVAVHRTARICAAADGGQVLVSNATREVVEDDLPAGVGLVDLGERRLKDLDRPARLALLVIEGRPGSGTAAERGEPVAPEPPERHVGALATLLERPWLVAALVAALVLGGVPIAASLTERDGVDSGGPARGLVPVPLNSVAVVDTRTNELVRVAPVGRQPTAVAIGAGSVWVVNRGEGAVSRIHPTGRSQVRRIRTQPEPSAVAVRENAVWVASSGWAVPTVPPPDSSVGRIDPEFDEFVRMSLLPGRTFGFTPRASAATGFGAVWIGTGRGVVRLDASGQLRGRIELGPLVDVAVGEGWVWALEAGPPGRLYRIDPQTSAVSWSATVGGRGVAVAVGEGAVWVARPASLVRLDVEELEPSAETPLHGRPVDVAVGEGAVWIATATDSTVVKLDPSTGDVRARIRLGNPPAALASAPGRLWITVATPPPVDPPLAPIENTPPAKPPPAVTPPPAEYGAVAVSLISLMGERAAITRVPRAPGLDATFVFRTRPRGRADARVAWLYNNREIGRVRKPVETSIGSTISKPIGRGLPAGYFRCVLEIRLGDGDWTAVAEARARVG